MVSLNQATHLDLVWKWEALLTCWLAFHVFTALFISIIMRIWRDRPQFLFFWCQHSLIRLAEGFHSMSGTRYAGFFFLLTQIFTEINMRACSSQEHFFTSDRIFVSHYVLSRQHKKDGLRTSYCLQDLFSLFPQHFHFATWSKYSVWSVNSCCSQDEANSISLLSLNVLTIPELCNKLTVNVIQYSWSHSFIWSAEREVLTGLILACPARDAVSLNN